MSDPRLRALVERISYPGFRFELCRERNLHFLRVVCDNGRDNVTGQPYAWNGRKWRLSIFMTGMEVVNTAFKAVLTAQEHEARELFKVDGIALMDSHRDLASTLEFMKTGGGHGREEAAK